MKVGDVVRLKSGGPEMTVGRMRAEKGVGTPDRFDGWWFRDGELQTVHSFPSGAFEVVGQREVSPSVVEEALKLLWDIKRGELERLSPRSRRRLLKLCPDALRAN